MSGWNELDNSRTYKIRTGVDDAAIYFIIVGNDKPFAFFFNSKKMENFAWITKCMNDMSRLLQASISIEQVISDMKEVFDPKGGYNIPDGSGRKVNSVIHHLGLVLEHHMKIMEREKNENNTEESVTPE